MVHFFLIKFKTLGLLVESDLTTKLCAKACLVNDESFSKCLLIKMFLGQERNTRSFFPRKVLISTFFVNEES